MSEADRAEAAASNVAAPSDPITVGSVASLRSFPVKSLDAGTLDSTRVLATGLEHDRGWAVMGDDSDVVTAKQAPQLREVRARVPDTAGSSPAVLLPGEDRELQEANADAALSRVVGRSVRLQPASDEATGFAEVAPVHVVSRQSLEAAAASEGTTLGDPACSIEEPRANIVLDLGNDAGLETAWVGRDVQVGDVVLRISKLPKNCLGVYADVVRPGSLKVGDDVRLA